MANYCMPFILEDRTGDATSTEFDDIYDRMFFGVNSITNLPGQPRGSSSTRIFELGSRSPARMALTYSNRDPAIILDFGANGALGTVLFVKRSVSMTMGNWLKKAGLFGRSTERKFQCSDNEEYKWTFRASDEAEWTCTTDNGYLAAEYKLKVPDEPRYSSSSGNALTVYESYSHIALELLASLTIMRHIQRHNI